MRQTDIKDLLESQDGGTLKEKIESILSDVAAAVVDNGKPGTVVLEMNMTRIKNSSQINLATKLKYKRPRPRGHIAENYETDTPMFVNQGGKVTLFAEDQTDMFMGKQGQRTE